MNLTRVLTKLEYPARQRESGLPVFETCCTWKSTYEQMSGAWVSTNAPLLPKSVFEAAWEEILIEDAATEYEKYRTHETSGYAPITNQLDMLYWDVASGVFGQQAKDSAWFKSCSGTKAEFPKPN